MLHDGSVARRLSSRMEARDRDCPGTPRFGTQAAVVTKNGRSRISREYKTSAHHRHPPEASDDTIRSMSAALGSLLSAHVEHHVALVDGDHNSFAAPPVSLPQRTSSLADGRIFEKSAAHTTS